jgi:hypothetical protein
MIEKVKELMIGKTIEDIEFSSYQSPNDTMIFRFTDKTSLKLMSDPNMCFDGLAFYQIRTKTVEVPDDERIK